MSRAHLVLRVDTVIAINLDWLRFSTSCCWLLLLLLLLLLLFGCGDAVGAGVARWCFIALVMIVVVVGLGGSAIGSLKVWP